MTTTGAAKRVRARHGALVRGVKPLLFGAGLAAGVLAATPAAATTGYRCEPVAGAGPRLHLVVGHAVAPQIVAAARLDDGRLLTTQPDGAVPPTLVIVRSWIDKQRLWIDLADAQAMRWEGQLRASWQPRLRGRPAAGTFVRGGRTYRVRCTEA